MVRINLQAEWQRLIDEGEALLAAGDPAASDVFGRANEVAAAMNGDSRKVEKPPRLEAEAVDLMADGEASLARGDRATAIDRFLRRGRVLDREKRSARRVEKYGSEEEAERWDELTSDWRRMWKLTMQAELAREFDARIFVGLKSFAGFSKPVAVFERWQGRWQEAAEQLFCACCGDLDENGCWPWIGAVNRKGIPVVSIGGPLADHPGREFGYRLYVGEFKRGTALEATCGNDKCVNLDHTKVVKRKLKFDGSEGGTPGDIIRGRRRQ